MPKKVMFLLDKSDDEKNTLDALRSTLGLSVANHYSYAVVMNHTLGKFDDYNAENLEWIRDMEGEAYSTEQANVDNSYHAGRGWTEAQRNGRNRSLRQLKVHARYEGDNYYENIKCISFRAF
jgi:hypothetical protein